jgi:hypothetical protein
VAEEIVIHDLNYKEFTEDVRVNGERKARGLIKRDYKKYPVGCYGCAPPYHAVEIPLIPRSEWPERIRDMEAANSRLSDLERQHNVPCLDQNGKGYCWAHSTTGCVMALRAVMNQPTVALSAYAVACVIKNFRDEGGWGALSLDFITSRGVPTEELWPMQSMDRRNDNARTWENAALNKVTEGWVDLQAAQYDRNLTFDQVGSLLLARVPGVGDYNWWGHSVKLVDLVNGASLRDSTRMGTGKLATTKQFERIWGVNTEAGGFGVRIRNSWGAGWGDQGFGVLAGQKAIPDGAVAPRAALATAA